MGEEKSAAWYDAHDKRISSLPLEENPYEFLYGIASLTLPRDKSVNIADLGCGTGCFASQLKRDGYKPGQYTGYDFSKVNIRIAREREPWWNFVLQDVTKPDFKPEADVYVMLEFLEHINDDLGVLEKIPSGKHVVLSVPSFDYEAHVRHFDSIDEVGKRYSRFINIQEVHELPTGDKAIFVVAGTRW